MAGPESLLPGDRLRRRVDYQRCYRHGRRWHGSLLTVHAIRNEEGGHRLGVTAVRRVGNAVVRQRLRRRTREIYRRWSGRRNAPPADIVVHLRPQSATACFADLKSDLLAVLERLSTGARSEKWS